jgi:hypothetical protein
VKRDGAVLRLAGADAAAHLGLPRVAAELYRSARHLRVFVLRPAQVPERPLVDLILLPADEVRARLDDGAALLSRRR